MQDLVSYCPIGAQRSRTRAIARKIPGISSAFELAKCQIDNQLFELDLNLGGPQESTSYTSTAIPAVPDRNQTVATNFIGAKESCHTGMTSVLIMDSTYLSGLGTALSCLDLY